MSIKSINNTLNQLKSLEEQGLGNKNIREKNGVLYTKGKIGYVVLLYC